MGKKSGSGMNHPDHISESLETIFWVKILKLYADPGSGMEKIRIRDKHPGSATPLKIFEKYVPFYLLLEVARCIIIIMGIYCDGLTGRKSLSPCIVNL
jgi:hypothetical protein